jgi:hypothetical protein
MAIILCFFSWGENNHSLYTLCRTEIQRRLKNYCDNKVANLQQRRYGYGDPEIGPNGAGEP